jgi:polysaccharide export outer membrane protein/exopolysaccharide production protein ExoF
MASDSSNVYRPWTQDRVRITVYEWRPSRDELFEWRALNAEYTAQPSGNVSVPPIGKVLAAGLTRLRLRPTRRVAAVAPAAG